MVGLTHAARIAMHDGVFFPSETTVILTSTISDAQLVQYTFADELRITRALTPDYVLPFDFPVYGDMDPDHRREHVEQVAAGTADMHRILGTTPPDEVERICSEKNLPRSLVEPVQSTTVIPLIKGTTPTERRVILDTADQLDAPAIAKYGVQYMTVGSNGSYPELQTDLEHINDESNEYPTLVVGLLSPDGRYSLDGLPDNVVAGAGTNQWVQRVAPTEHTAREMRDAFADLYNTASDSLNLTTQYHPGIAAATADTPPDPLEKTPGHAVGDDLSPSIAGTATDNEYGFGQRKRPEDALDAAESGRVGGSQSL